MNFTGTRQEFLEIFRKNECQYVVVDMPDRTRVKIGGVYVDWWWMSQKKTVRVHGSPPESVRNIRLMIAIECGNYDECIPQPTPAHKINRPLKMHW